IQPSGELHIGNYLGAVQNWVRLQEGRDTTYFCVVDLHALTGNYEPADLRRRRHEMAVSLLAAGLDAERCTLFFQGGVPQHAELAWIFNTVTPLGELERQTQYKDKASRQESVLTGVLTYPVLQAADILLYHAERVPVGEDQVQHLELSREIARRWNARFASDVPYFPEPQPLLTPVRRLMGLDGQAKMSKSLGNTIGLLETREQIWEKLRPAMTDPARVRKTDPGTPEVCNIFAMHKAFSDEPTVETVATNCRTAAWGCIDCKKVLAESMETVLVPIRGRAADIGARPSYVTDVLEDGAKRARTTAQETMRQVYERMGLTD
ncbi:MAG TPA: tryptophan--tRNA ligase, partial [Gemmatimonadaceae bacterium]|nr:tryptophan--tRNA ligase [Gemmatimonadaceae bacterium]